MSLAAAALALFGAFALASARGDSFDAPTGSTPGGGTSGGNFTGGGDDETVGTLPTFHGGPTFDLIRYARTQRPMLYVQGSVDAVLSSAVSVRGDNRVLAQAMPGGELRLVFLGEVQVSFDRGAFDAASLRVGVAVPNGSPVLRSSVSWNGQSIAGWMWSYVYEMPVAEFAASGLLDQSPMDAGVSTLQGISVVRAQASVDLVTLTQRN